MRNARLAMILAALGALGLGLWAQGCLFAPDDCKDLLKCGGAGGAGGGGSTSSAATSSAAMSSTGTCGAAGCTPCASDVDCGTPTFDGCTASTCEAFVCTPKATAGLPSSTQTPNDCAKSVCGADGKPMLVADPTDTPADDLNDCTEALCVDGAPTQMPVAIGTVCAGGTCDGAGVCFNCVKNSDCTMGTTPTCDPTVHTCISCSDGQKNGTETGVDCGGNCAKCDGAACFTAAECTSAHCVDGACCNTSCLGVCKSCDVPGLQGTCSNVPLGQTDIGTCNNAANQACDGAGSCKKAGGITCANDSECVSNTCLAGVCRAATGSNCTDDFMCASQLCKAGKCADCSVGADCLTTMICAGTTCKAPGGAPCEVNADCANGSCQNGLCKLNNGSACTTALGCSSGLCKNGVCASCIANFECPGSSCGAVPSLGINACTLPKDAYCSTTLPLGLGCNSGSCAGFPAKCK